MAKLDRAPEKERTTCTVCSSSLVAPQPVSRRGLLANYTSIDVCFSPIASRHEVTSHSSQAMATCHLPGARHCCQLISYSCWPSRRTSTQSSFLSSTSPPSLCSSSTSSKSQFTTTTSTSSAQLKMPRFSSPLCVYIFILLTLLTFQSSDARQGECFNFCFVSIMHSNLLFLITNISANHLCEFTLSVCFDLYS